MSKEDWAYYGPYESFPFPVPLPASLPTDLPHRSLCINRDWVPYVIGALKILLQPETWDAPAATLEPVRGMLYDLLADWQEPCVNDIQFRNPTACTLEVSLDGGASWTQIYDGAACISAKIADGTIPGSGKVPQAPAGYTTCVDYFPQIAAWGNYTLPKLVNAGDTLEASMFPPPQAWTDDIFTYALFCGDGSNFAFTTGCAAFELAHVGDPDPTAYHMELICRINGVYYHPMRGAITVPAGIINQPVVFLPNDGQTGDNFGVITFKIMHCAAGWVHTFDFATGQHGWNIRDDAFGVYVPGDGWHSQNAALHVQSPGFLLATKLIAFELRYHVLTPDGHDAGVQLFHLPFAGGSNLLFSQPTNSPIWTGAQNNAIGTCNIDAGVGDVFYNHAFQNVASTAVLVLERAILIGQGPDPF